MQMLNAKGTGKLLGKCNSSCRIGAKTTSEAAQRCDSEIEEELANPTSQREVQMHDSAGRYRIDPGV